MMPTADLFVRAYVLVDDALKAGAVAVPPRPGPAPACTDAEVLTVALVRHLLARPSEAGFLAEVRRDWAHYFPVLPAQSEFNRRVRWLWGACELLRQRLVGAVPADGWQQADTTALPVTHPSRVRRADAWQGRTAWSRGSAGTRPTASGSTASGQFNEQSVVAAYAHRPPIPAPVFDVLLGLLADGPGAVLDAGCGTGAVARRLAPHVARVDAVDVSRPMIDAGRRLPGGDHRRSAGSRARWRRCRSFRPTRSSSRPAACIGWSGTW
jgi:hypothetical protein